MSKSGALPYLIFRNAVVWMALLLLPHLTTSARAGLGTDWTRATDSAPWATIYPISSAIEYDNKLWATDGGAGGAAIWSSDNGAAWTLVCPQVPFSYQQFQLIGFKGKLWAIGNQGLDGHANEAWCSTDGAHWTLKTPHMPAFWTNQRSLVNYNDKLWIVGTKDTTWYYDCRKVYNTDDGINWTLVAESFPDEMVTINGYHRERYGYATVAFDGKIWLLGGMSVYEPRNDVWWTTDGIKWTRATASAGWAPRWGHSAVAFKGRIWVMGGKGEFNDAWCSADGKHWTCVIEQAPWRAREEHASVIWQDRIWILGGGYYGDAPGYQLRDVWSTRMSPGAPRIFPIADHTLTEGTGPYQEPAPLLLDGTLPVTWSAVAPPSGLTVDPATGAVSWPRPRYAAQPHRLQLQASNASGSAQTSWTLTVNYQPPPVISAPPFGKGAQTTVTWSAVPNISGYNIQRAATRDFTTPLETVNVSSTTLRRIFSSLPTDTTYWYRVRGNMVAGMFGAWSAPTSCTQDGTAPGGRVILENPTGSEAPALTARLLLLASDPGPLASGLGQVRLSTDQLNWTPWQPASSHLSAWIGHAGWHNFYVQLSDRMGNTRTLTTAGHIPSFSALFVDDDNSSGPWAGTAAKPYRRIQDALTAATPDAVIVVAPGTYRENIKFGGKNIFLRSADPLAPEIVKATTIDGQAKGSTVTFKGTESEACRLEGFTITNGKAPTGGGINGQNTRATIQFNRITSNTAYNSSYSEDPEGYGDYYESWTGYGGGLHGCDGPIRNNLIAGNRAGGATPTYTKTDGKPFYPPPGGHWYARFGGGALYACKGPIQNNTIWGNYTDGSFYEDEWNGIVNDLPSEGGLSYCLGPIENNIIWGNSGSPREGAYNLNGQLLGCSIPVYCCLSRGSYDTYDFDASLHNIPADDYSPRFADPVQGTDYRLYATSPCIDAGKYIAGLFLDSEGDPRGYDGGAMGGDHSGFDIGADEFHPVSLIWVSTPAGGEQYTGGSMIQVRWYADASQTGPIFTLQLYRGAGKITDLGEFSSTSGDGLATVTLPNISSTNLRLRAVSKSNPTLQGQSPPFTAVAANSVAPRIWGGYR